MHSKLIATWRVRHNGLTYDPGDEITSITPDQARALVDIGAAKWSPVLPGQLAEDQTQGNPEFDQSDESTESIDWEEESKKYHQGFGRYDIPGVGLVKGKDAAIEALKASRTQEGA